MIQPLVSFVIPTYNYGHLIADTLTCLQNQLYSNWEAIIIDDGSIDNTKSVISKFLKEDSRFIFLNQNNSGVSVARNNGLKRARGKYIQFLDADDLISKAKVQLQVNFLEQEQTVDLLSVNTRYFDTRHPDKLFTDLSLTNTSIRKRVSGKGFDVVTILIKNNPIVILNPLFRREILHKIPGFLERMDYLEDWDFWFQCAVKGFSFAHLDNMEALALVRSHPISASKQNNKIREGEGLLRDRMKNSIRESDFLTSTQKEFLLQINELELINTYKHLMAETNLRNHKQFKAFYRQMQEPALFLRCFIKAMNLRRKIAGGRHKLFKKY